MTFASVFAVLFITAAQASWLGPTCQVRVLGAGGCLTTLCPYRALRVQGYRAWWRVDLPPSAPCPPGELKDPSRAIPLGTIVAVAYTFFIYILLFFLSSFTCDRCLGRG